MFSLVRQQVRLVWLAGLVIAASVPLECAVAKDNETVLYAFCSKSNCSDGAIPNWPLTFDKAGNLYGVTFQGGGSDVGTVFKLTPGGTETVFYSFKGGSDGAYPNSPLTQDKTGNFYGTTVNGGGSGACGLGCGTVYKITPAGVETPLYAFCAQINCSDGEFPRVSSGLVLDKKGNLFGTTQYGGDGSDGIVFKIVVSDSEKVLHAFTSDSDAEFPTAGVIEDKSGNLYGTAPSVAGLAINGAVFKVTKKGKETLLYSFCRLARCTDGMEPVGGLTMDAVGNLYGTTEIGGAFGGGTVFRLTPDGNESVLYSFCAKANCEDGENPVSKLIMDKKGNLFGTTWIGGAHGLGTVFELAPDGTETVLHSFKGGADGQDAEGDLVMDAAGNLYGATQGGGGNNGCGHSYGCGTIFKIARH